jgi:mRNA-degrading endonuclease toxin of MazEF toxin-antitoxin module
LDGKGASFTRPALVMHVFGSRLALVIPLSTKLKEIPGYLPFEFKGKKISVCINNLRIVSQQRIFDRLGKITSDHFKVIKVELKKYYDL